MARWFVFPLLLGLAWHVPAYSAGWKSWLGIHEEDDRDSVRFNGGWPWVAIGKLVSSDGGHCSGTLIERNMVLTAAHCVSDKRGGFIDPRKLTFSAGFDNGEARASSIVRAIHTDPDFAFTPDGQPADLSLDWAVLELDRQLYDGGWLRPVPLASASQARQTANDGREFAQAGYSGDHSETLTRNQRCMPEGLVADGRIILHLCDATFGDSGSPILIHKNGDFFIAGVHVAVVHVEGGRFGAAVIPERIPYF